MENQTTVEHKGRISEINNDTVFVKIIAKSACSDCHVKGVCNASDQEEKIIEIKDSSGKFSLGEKVVVTIKQNQGFLAAFLAYILPFIILVGMIVTLKYYTNDEVISGLIGLGSLVPYYLILYLFRERLKQKFTFNIRKDLGV